MVKNKYYKDYPNLPSLPDHLNKKMLEDKSVPKKKKLKKGGEYGNVNPKLSIVKNFFKKNEDEIKEIDKNFRNLNHVSEKKSKNAQFSKTFFNERKSKIEKYGFNNT